MHREIQTRALSIFEQESVRSAEHPNRIVTYRVFRDDWFVVSGTENGRVFYQKTMLRDSTFKTFRIEYDESQKRTFHSVTAFIARSFKGYMAFQIITPSGHYLSEVTVEWTGPLPQSGDYRINVLPDPTTNRSLRYTLEVIVE